MTTMFNISEAVSIGLHICTWLAQQENAETFFSTRKISSTFRFSTHHVAKVVQKLMRAGILDTTRGGQGGIRLAQHPDEITVYAIHVAIDGEVTISNCLLDPGVCPGNCCVLGRWMAEESQRMVAMMKETTLSAVLKSVEK